MRAARLHAPGDLRIEELPEPEPGADEVKVRVRLPPVRIADVI
jgi:L-iditol 2-dehydrogenase